MVDGLRKVGLTPRALEAGAGENPVEILILARKRVVREVQGQLGTRRMKRGLCGTAV